MLRRVFPAWRWVKGGLLSGLLWAGCTGTVDGDSAPDPAPSGNAAEKPAAPAAPAAGTPGGAAASPSGSQPPGSPPAGVPNTSVPGTMGAVTCAAPAPGLLPLRRLVKRQFSNAVRELFGATADASAFPDTSIRKGYRSFADANTVTADGAEDISEAAVAIAAKATATLPLLLGCTPGMAADDACVRGYVRTLTRKAYRRPAEPAELTTLDKLYADLRAQGSAPADAVAGIIEAVLASPQFLYQSEVGRESGGAAGSITALTDHEVAARLSFALWDTLPDAELSRAADDGKLRSREQIEAQARRLVADKRAEGLLVQFVEDWLELYRLAGQTKDPKRHPEWTAAFGSTLRNELTAFSTEVAFRGDRLFSTLMAAPWTMVSAATASIYGVTKVTGNAPVRLEADPKQRAGVLTSAAFLSAHAGAADSLPVVRGATIRHHVLCSDLEPPPGVNITSPAPDPNQSTRARFAQHSQDAACAACHALLDPLGFGLENYDAIGRFRVDEGPKLPINASGEVRAAGDASGPFVGGVELSKKLGGSTTAAACFARQLFSYLNSRPYDETADACSLSYVDKKFQDSRGDLRELVVAIASSDAFAFRRLPERAP